MNQEEQQENNDENLGEREALLKAKSEGIYFVDRFYVAETTSLVRISEEFETREEAEAELRQQEDPEFCTVVQSRSQIAE